MSLDDIGIALRSRAISPAAGGGDQHDDQQCARKDTHEVTPEKVGHAFFPAE